MATVKNLIDALKAKANVGGVTNEVDTGTKIGPFDLYRITFLILDGTMAMPRSADIIVRNYGEGTESAFWLGGHPDPLDKEKEFIEDYRTNDTDTRSGRVLARVGDGLIVEMLKEELDGTMKRKYFYVTKDAQSNIVKKEITNYKADVQ